MIKWFIILVLFCVPNVASDIGAELLADYSDQIIAYRMYHSHLEMEWILTAQESEIIGKEIYRLCTIMKTDDLASCDAVVNQYNRILSD